MALEEFVCLMDEDPFIRRDFGLLLLLVHDEAHSLQHFIEGDIVDDCFARGLNLESLQQAEELLDELLSCILVTVDGCLFFEFRTFNYFLFISFLSSLRIVIEMFGYRLMSL